MFDYRRELEKAARQMILIHDTRLLTKLILRTVVRSLKIKHAGFFLYRRDKDDYLLTVSKGERGLRVPEGFAKVGKNNPLIRYFLEEDKKINKNNFLLYEELSNFLKKGYFKKKKDLRVFFEELKFQLELFKAKVCIPGFFRNRLIGILFLGDKINKEAFLPEELGFLSVLTSDVVMAVQNVWLFEDLKSQLEKNRNLFLSLVKALASAIEAKDKYTSGHTGRVTFYALILLEEIAKMKKLSASKYKSLREKLKIASLLHDIGKIGVSEKILNKKGFLTKEERKEIEKHPLLGAEIMKPVEEFKDIIEAVKHHHERYDGKGYPDGLKGRKIPFLSAIISVADAYDAMTSERPYRSALSKEEAIKVAESQSKKQFHPLVVKALLKLYKKGKL